MREDADFDGYLAARWPTLVRTLVLLGCPEDLAPDVALDAVARCRSDWSRTRMTDDVDVVVHRSLLEAWEERRATPWWEKLAPHVPHDGELLPEVADSLDELDTDVRTRLVLQRHGGLDRGQSAATTGRGAGALPSVPTTEQLRAAVEEVGVLAPPTPEVVVDREQQRRRQRRSRQVKNTLALALPVVLLLAGISWWLSPRLTAEEALALVDVEVRQNAADVGWYAEGRLHLEHVVLDVPGVRQFEPLWHGAAYGDEQGRVYFVSNAGLRTLLGRKDPSAPLAVSESHGWVVWVEPDATRPKIVVHELSSFGRFASRDLVPPQRVGDELRLVSVDGDIVYYVDGAGAHAWTATSGLRLDLGRRQLLDANARTWVSQPTPNVINVAPAYSAEGFSVPGAGAVLSADGDLVLTRDTSQQASFGPVLIYDTATGADVSVGLGPEDVPLAAELGPERTVTYILARAEDRPENADFLRSSFSGQLELRTCAVATGECESLQWFPSTGSRPLLSY